MKIASFDLDGVIDLGPDNPGLTPGQNDIIITGRSFEEKPETTEFLKRRNIYNNVYYNPLLFKNKTRESSGYHKVNILTDLIFKGLDIKVHFEDDPIQADIIEKFCPNVNVVRIIHNLTEKENVRHE